MKIICGLGNPDSKYAQTRHNMGFLVLDQFSEKNKIKIKEKKFHSLIVEFYFENQKILLVKPQTYMNHSGQAVSEILSFFKEPSSNLLVIHDEIDFPFGKIKLKHGGGHAGHNGLKSIFDEIKDDSFYRLRVGIGRPRAKEEVADYVLNPFSKEQEKELETIFAQTTHEIEKFAKKISVC